MNKETLKALKGSIHKWEKIVAGIGDDDGPDNCPLCQLFNTSDVDELEACNGCPVAEKTGEQYCLRTPYDQYSGAATTSNAKKELAFLKSLLPKRKAARL